MAYIPFDKIDWLKNINFKKTFDKLSLDDFIDEYYNESEYEILYHKFLQNCHKIVDSNEFYIEDTDTLYFRHQVITYTNKNFFNQYLSNHLYEVKDELFSKSLFFNFLRRNSDWLKKENINQFLTTKLIHNYQKAIDGFYAIQYQYFISEVKFYNLYNPFSNEEDFNHFLAKTALDQLHFTPYELSYFGLKNGWEGVLGKYFKKVLYYLRTNHDKIDKTLLAIEINRLKGEALNIDAEVLVTAINNYEELLGDLNEINNPKQKTLISSVVLNLANDSPPSIIEHYFEKFYTNYFKEFYDQDQALPLKIRRFIFDSFIPFNKNQRFRRKDFLQENEIIPIGNSTIFIEFFWVLYKEGVITDSFVQIAAFLEYKFPELGSKAYIQQIPSKHNFEAKYKNPNIRTFLNRPSTYNKK